MAIPEDIKKLMPTVSVGVLTANMMNLGSEITLIEKAGVKLLHFDVMDGVFCPMLTLGPAFVKAVTTSMYKDVHLMTAEPLAQIESFVKAGADMITFNIESTTHLHQGLRIIDRMENVNDPERPILRGLSLNPSTPLAVIEPVIDDVEIVLLLAVNPGFSGQGFIPSVQDKIQKLKSIIAAADRDILIIVDGGIKKDNIAQVAAMGPDIIITGSAVFDGKAPAQNAAYMLKAVKQASGN